VTVRINVLSVAEYLKACGQTP